MSLTTMNRLVARYGGSSRSGRDDMAYSTIGPTNVAAKCPSRRRQQHRVLPNSLTIEVNATIDDVDNPSPPPPTPHSPAASCSAMSLTNAPSIDKAAAFLKTTTIASVVGRVATTLASATATAIENECDYDARPTDMYLAVQDGRWDDVVRYCKTRPREASIWVYRTEGGGGGGVGKDGVGIGIFGCGKSLRWRLLPIHAACVFFAPIAVVRALLNAYPGGASVGDDQGKLPLHLCLRRNRLGDDTVRPNMDVVSFLANAYPAGIHVPDDGGRTPHDLVIAIRCGATRAMLMQSLGIDTFVAPCGDGGAVSRPNAAAIRQPQQRAIEKARMDGELLARMNPLNRRRDSLDGRLRDDSSPNEAGGIEVEYDVDEIMMLEEKKGVEGVPDDGVGVEVEYDVDDIIIGKDDARDADKDNKVEVENDVDKIVAKEENAVVVQSIGSLSSSSGDHEDDGHLADVDWGANGNPRVWRSIADMAAPSLRDQIRARVERRKTRIKTCESDIDGIEYSVHRDISSSRPDPPTHDPLDIDIGPLQLVPQRTEGEWNMTDSSNYDEIVTIPSSICSSTTGGTKSIEDQRLIQLTVNDSMVKTKGIGLENKIHKASLVQMSSSSQNHRGGTSMIVPLPMSSPAGMIDLEVYNSTSLVTAHTCDMTDAPSGSYEEGSLCETYTSSIKREKQKGETVSIIDEASQDKRKIDPIDDENLSTPRLLMALEKFRMSSAIAGYMQSAIDSDVGESEDLDNGNSTPNLLKKADRFFCYNETPSSPARKVDSGSSTCQSKFDQIMAKYESMSINEDDYSVGKLYSNRQNHLSESVPPCDAYRSTPPPRHVKDHTTRVQLERENFGPIGGPSESLLKNRLREPTSIDSLPVSELRLQPSTSNDSSDFTLCIQSTESDLISALSMITENITLGSASTSTENSAVIECYVQSIVHNIVAYEVENAGSMKKELEAALKGKLQLKAQVKKLISLSNQQSVQLKRERETNNTRREKFNREMEIHLARKAADLEKCAAVALDQAEESKRRALELAQQDMEKEVALLRSQLDAVQSIGVPIDRSLLQALGLVESNQRAMRLAAERDAESALEMKEEIERSFIDAIAEFEAWSEKQLRQMESRWERMKA